MVDSVRLLDRLHWLGHASFRVDGAPTVYFDPWKLGGDLPPADIVLITHDHFDHCSPPDVDRISGPDTVIIANPSAAKKLRGDVRVLRPGESVHVAGVTVDAVPAYNIGKTFHPRQAEHVGYVVTLNGESIYLAGDTDLIPEMLDIRCDIALLPVGGTYTMDAKEAAEAASRIRPKVAIPMHFGNVVGANSDAERFRELCRSPVVVLEQE